MSLIQAVKQLWKDYKKSQLMLREFREKRIKSIIEDSQTMGSGSQNMREQSMANKIKEMLTPFMNTMENMYEQKMQAMNEQNAKQTQSSIDQLFPLDEKTNERTIPNSTLWVLIEPEIERYISKRESKTPFSSPEKRDQFKKAAIDFFINECYSTDSGMPSIESFKKFKEEFLIDKTRNSSPTPPSNIDLEHIFEKTKAIATKQAQKHAETLKNQLESRGKQVPQDSTKVATSTQSEIQSEIQSNVPNLEGSQQQQPKNKNKNLFPPLNLPSTNFPMKANASINEPKKTKDITETLYNWQRQRSQTPDWILHDGPPYANGFPHMGHAMNKILKDIFVRYKAFSGNTVSYIPGWDCHGLPIELKAMEAKEIDPSTPKKIQSDSSHDENLANAVKVRKSAQKVVHKFQKIQQKDFQRWGIMGDWKNHYKTMDKEYEVQQLRVFYEMFSKGLIYRSKKPVFWSPWTKTALAEAELEYNDSHVSKSTFIRYPITQTPPEINSENLYALVWTTTPWTIPASQAISYNNNIKYCIISAENIESNEVARYIVAESLIPSFSSFFTSITIEKMIDSNACADSESKKQQDVLAQCCASHPLVNTNIPFLQSDHVVSSSGTGLVHTAPSHGIEDFNAWLSNGYSSNDILSLITDDGHFDSSCKDLGYPYLADQFALSKGSQIVTEKLKEVGNLIFSTDFIHKYPYDWRTKKPIMLRATEQWFASLKPLLPLAIKASSTVSMFPSVSRSRLEAMLSSRNDWCISRQRSWGVPIPVFYHKETGETLMNDETILHLLDIVSERGTDAWFYLDTPLLLPEKYHKFIHSTSNSTKSESESEKVFAWERGTETMDVWFDSGASWAGVLRSRNLNTQADLYLEGSDQHRGWFQSSILTYMTQFLDDTQNAKPPYRNLVTHGFVLDEQGRKMSKSIGNMIEPRDLIDANGNMQQQKTGYGADVIRLWVASTDSSRDVNIGLTLMNNIATSYRKIRNTFRFLLGNLYDYDWNYPQVPLSERPIIDQYLLHVMHHINIDITAAYDSFNVRKVYSILSTFITTTLSSFYFEVAKDICYSEAPNSPSRRSVQHVLSVALSILHKGFGPILAHTTHELVDYFPPNFQYPKNAPGTREQDIKDLYSMLFPNKKFNTASPDSLAHAYGGWISTDPKWTNETLAKKMAILLKLRHHINSVLETFRLDQQCGTSKEMALHIDTNYPELFDTFQMDGLLSVSHCSIAHDPELETLIKNSENIHTTNTFDKITFSIPSENPQIPTLHIRATVSHPKHLGLFKCPRCWLHHSTTEDALCTRCANI